MPRTVTLSFGSRCTPFIHQPILLQISIGNTWVPPTPIRVPPSGDVPNEGTPIQQIADAARNALLAQITRLPIGMPTATSEGTDPEIGSTIGFSFMLEDAVDEIDVGLTQDGTVRSTQLAVAIDVDSTESDRDLLVKTLDALQVWTHAGGWGGDPPGKVRHGKRRMRNRRKSRTVYKTGTWSKDAVCMLSPIGGGGFGDWFDGDGADLAAPVREHAIGGFPSTMEYFAEGHHPAPLFAQPGTVMRSPDSWGPTEILISTIGLPADRPRPLPAPTEGAMRMAVPPEESRPSAILARHQNPIRVRPPVASTVVLRPEPPLEVDD